MTLLNKLFVHLQNQKIQPKDLEGKHDFILTDLKIVKSDNGIRAYQNIQFYNKTFLLMADVDEDNLSLVRYTSFRPKNTSFEINFFAPLNTFFEDLIKMHLFAQKFQLGDKAIIFSFEQICINHINEIGRLVDEDLYGYIDQIILMIRLITVQFYNFDLKDEYSNDIWIELRDYAFSNFEQYIYLNKIGLTSQPELVKLSNFKRS